MFKLTVGRRLFVLAAVAAALVLPATTAFAHETRTVGDGKYSVTVGWDVEPAFVGQKNAASIRISQAGTNPAVPVEGAEKTLKVRIKQGSSEQEFPLRTPFRQPGYYVADLLPSRTGDYVFTFVGTIDGTNIQESFDSADKKFNGVEPIDTMTFPKVASDAAQATAAAQSAQTLAYVGIALGAVALLAAVVLWLTRPRTTRSGAA
jgi:hypothetical protein